MSDLLKSELSELSKKLSALTNAFNSIRVGHGYDVHRLVTGRALILGGVTIEWDKGLDGHSDADVLCHAIMDAMLGAAGLSDIGHQFPDSDDKYKGANSLELLRETSGKLADLGYTVGNIDCTIVAQQPKLKSYIQGMRQNIAEICKITVGNVSVKATTEEYLGFTGSGDGICAHCVCIIKNFDLNL